MTVLKPSPIHGLGVFAAEKISAGAAVYQHRFELDLVLPADAFKELDQRDQRLILHHGSFDKRVNGYCLPYDNLRFLNHSNDPNLKYAPETGQIVALQDIAVGTELTQDYRDFSDDVEARLH